MGLDVLKSSALRVDYGFTAALELFEGLLMQRNPRFERILEEVLKMPGILPRFINGASLLRASRRVATRLQHSRHERPRHKRVLGVPQEPLPGRQLERLSAEPRIPRALPA